MNGEQTRAGVLTAVLAVWGLVSGAGCLIGTWPTPEDRPRDSAQRPGGTALAPESCDDRDNDADGVVDEGCPCAGADRSCIGISGGQCGSGVQRCEGGYWTDCHDIQPSGNAPQTTAVTVTGVVPGQLVLGGTETVRVTAQTTSACPGIEVVSVEVSMASADPVMRVKTPARDDGVAPDDIASDGEFAVELPNVFGPGVPPQMLVVRATAAIGGEDVSGTTDAELVEP